MAATLYEKYGGFAAVSRMTLLFYERVLDSDVVAPYFEDIDMARLIDHQTRFIASLLGGPAHYSDQHLAATHKRLGITHADFDELLRILRESLLDFGFEPADADVVVGNFEARRDVIVAPSAG